METVLLISNVVIAMMLIASIKLSYDNRTSIAVLRAQFDCHRKQTKKTKYDQDDYFE